MISFKKIVFSFFVFSIINISFINAEGIYLNNQKVEGSSPIIIKDDRAYIAVSDISVILGGVVSWDANTKSATVTTDNITLKFTNNSNMIEINGDNYAGELKAFMDNSKLIAPATILRDYLGFKISWDYKTRIFTINSSDIEISELIDEIEYSAKRDLIKVQNAVGDNNISFTYALTDDVKNEKYLADGKYFIFKGGEKGNITKALNGYFYMNVYTYDVYYYPINGADDSSLIKKYSDGKEITNFVKNDKNAIHSLIATTHMINDIQNSDNALSEFTYTKIDNITSQYLNHIPKSTYYYYQASKKENDILKSQFEIAQDAYSLDVYIFLKRENGINIIKLPNEFVKTIELVARI